MDKDSVLISVRIGVDMYDRIKQGAAEDYTTTSTILRQAVAEYMYCRGVLPMKLGNHSRAQRR